MSCITLIAQSEEMKSAVDAAKVEFAADSLEIISELYSDINLFTDICTDELTLDPQYVYTAMFIIDDCNQCGTWLAFRANGVDVTLGSKSKQIENIHVVRATIHEDETEIGQIIGCVKTKTKHKAHLMVARK